MKKGDAGTFARLSALALGGYALHKAVWRYRCGAAGFSTYSLEALYLVFSVTSALILYIVLRIDRRSHDQTGMSFLLLTTAKMLGCYLLGRPLITGGTACEKESFLFLFIFFLAIETILTIRILNKKQ
jgi:hypothetical protein